MENSIPDFREIRDEKAVPVSVRFRRPTKRTRAWYTIRGGRNDERYYHTIKEIETVYPHLEHVANDWMRLLKIDTRFPSTFGELRDLCHASGQQEPTPLILKYGVGGFNTLHQDLYGEVYFPIQLAFFLNEPDVDYTNGEFVLTQQTPRAQSKAIVLRPRKGDMIIFTTNFRPVRGSHGFYRANMRHGVSEVLSGQRYTLGVIFHDATS